MGKAIFITGTDTGVGKTVITGLLGRFLLEKGVNVVTQKWVQTGSAGFSQDLALHMELMGKRHEDIEEYFSEVAPYVLDFPSSPHLAAELEKRKIDAGIIENSFLRLKKDFDIVLVEGSGGLMVPLSDKLVIVDLVEKFKMPVIVVAENRLGAINQAILTIEALKKRGIEILGIIFNQKSKEVDDVILKDNPKIVKKLTGVEILGQLPYSKNTEELYGQLKPAAERIFTKLSAERCTPSAEQIIQKDLKYNWHPYTQMKDCEEMPPIPIERAEGIKLYDYDGNFYYDTISSWWCNVHGHNNPVIKNAIKKQLDSLEHVLFAGFTHKPAVEFAEKLVEITPKNLTRVFYSDNGSTAVEVAMKMSFQYWKNAGEEKKTRFVSLDMAYHGDTVGTMSVSGVDLYNNKFKPLFFDSFKAPTPHCCRCPFEKKKEDCSLECLSRMEEILKENAGSISAIIIEPMLLGAGGMIVYPAEYLKGVWDLSRKYNTHLIADEVATGFGRTGKMFACEHAGVEPDFMCLSKGITSGYLPMGATLTTENVYRAFYGDHDKFKTFYHGHTYTANPVSCAAACASIDLFKEHNVLKNVAEINLALRSFLKEMSELSMVKGARCIGAVGAMELPEGVSKKIYKEGLRKNLLLRPLGNIIYFFLPLCTSQDELEDIFNRTGEILKATNHEFLGRICHPGRPLGRSGIN